MAAVEISASPELEALRPAIDLTLRRLQDRLNSLPADEVIEIVEAVTLALAPREEPTPSVVATLAGGRQWSPAQRAEAEVEVLTRTFARRRMLLDGALTTSQVARLLGTSRQTPHDRVESGTLLAVMDRGALRFPPWQFDPEGPDGVIEGLPAVIRALDVSPMAKIAWLTRPNQMLDGATPLDRIRAGEVDRVLSLARSVGVS
jgi:excisionase family DNA binding protein